MKIKYEFATETVEIEVTAEWAEVLAEYDRVEYNNNHKETRRHEHFTYGSESNWMADSELDPLEIRIKEETIKESFDKATNALSSLTESQRSLVYKRRIMNMSVKEIAERENVTHQAITNRLKKIDKKMKKFV